MTALPFSGQLISCPLCASDNHIVVGEVDRRGAPLRTVLCKGCGHVFTNPQPTSDELESFYAERYRKAYKGITTPKRKHIYRAGLRAVERLRHLRSHCGSGSKVLDVGSGGGEFVYLLRKAGYVSRGVEPNQGYAEFSKSSYDVDIETGTLEDIHLSPEEWDAITLHHVLEHLADPIGALRMLATGLAKDGKLIVEVPNVEARYHGPRRLFHLAHLHVFSVDGLERAAEMSGLKTIAIQLQPHTKNVLAVFSKGDAPATDAPNPDVADRIEAALKSYTSFRDYLTKRPYRRLWANAKRPVKERFALARLGDPKDAKDILDRVFETEAGKTSAS